MRSGGIKFVGVGVLGLLFGAATASAQPPESAREWANGRAAVDLLGGRLPQVAEANALTAEELRTRLLTDSSLFVDLGHRLLYVDPIRPSGETTPSTTTAGTLTSESVFTLHSAPAASRVIYLDFNGHTLSGTAWNKSTGNRSCYTDAYDSDGVPSSFSQAELKEIVGVWSRVAEDFAPFGIDVTTQEPSSDKITRSGSSDESYGTRTLITNSKTRCAKNKTLYQSVCSNGCGGVAYVGVFDDPANHAYYQPALVFQNGVGAGQKNLAEATSHEVGHNLGLGHDGTGSTGYYTGHGSWAPIMGVGYYEAITQWSRGEYADANNVEDDFVLMGASGASPVSDDHPAATPTALTVGGSANGVVSTRDDKDVFTFTVAAADGSTVEVVTTASPAAISPDLDIKLTLTRLDGTAVSDDPLSGSTSGDAATGMGASITQSLPSGTYLLTVDGVGAHDVRTTGYSDYGSLGRYTISVAATAPSS